MRSMTPIPSRFAKALYYQTEVRYRTGNEHMPTPVLSRYHFRTSDLETLFIEEQHGSFGGPSLTSGAYYGASSDDFRGYVWKIPETSMLLQQRKEIGADHWPLEGNETVGTLSKAPAVSFGIRPWCS